MSYLSLQELTTHAYDEELQSIIREDKTIAMAAIDAAMEMVRSKLMRHYDVDVIHAKVGADRNPLLLKITKDIAIWELIGLANPGIDYEDKKFRYQQAMDWLTAVYKGMPANLPILMVDDSKTGGTSFALFSNPKRENHF